MRLRLDPQSILAACTLSLGALNTVPCTIVSYCQMPRCYKVLSRLSQVLQRLWQAGFTTARPPTCATLTGSTSCTHLRSLNQTSKSSIRP